MGHLINPMAFRVGWTQQWVDDFFMETRYYPEFLHRFLRFRYFLNTFFQVNNNSTNPFDEHLVSHYRFSVGIRGFALEIYYYNSRFDTNWYLFFDRIADGRFGLKFFPKKWAEPPAFHSWNRKCLSLLYFLYFYSVNGVLDETFTYRLFFFKSFEHNLRGLDVMNAYQELRRCEFPKLSPSEKEFFILLFCFRYSSLQEVGRLRRVFRGRGLRTVNYEIVAQTFFGHIFLNHITRPFLQCYGNWFKFLGQYCFLDHPLSITFLQISNDQVSARFIAKFLALRFSQGVTVRSIINPIRRDLRLGKRFARRLNLKARSTEVYMKSPESRGLSFFQSTMSFFQLFDQKFYSTLSTFWSFDHFSLTYFLWAEQRQVYREARGLDNESFVNKIFLSLKRNKKTVKRSAFISKFYMELRSFLENRLLFNFASRLSMEARKLFFYSFYAAALMMELAGLYHVNYESSRSFFDKSSFFSMRNFSKSTFLFLNGGALSDFLKFSLRHPVNARKFDTLFSVNRRVHRSFAVPALGLNGFRIRLHGRFTRKQIASSYHFQEGAMPLSSINAVIDYGFATVPLRNSAIGIKVWLYRQGSPQAIADHEYSFEF